MPSGGPSQALGLKPAISRRTGKMRVGGQPAIMEKSMLRGVLIRYLVRILCGVAFLFGALLTLTRIPYHSDLLY